MDDAYLDDALNAAILDEIPTELLSDGPDGMPGDELTCDMCGKQAKTARGLKMHMTRTHGTGADKVPATKRRKNKADDELRNDLETFLMMIGVGVSMANETDGMIVTSGSPKLAAALVNTSKKNPKLRKVLEQMTAGWAYTELMMACAAIILPIMANHNLLPEQFGMLAAMANGVPDSPPEGDVWS